MLGAELQQVLNTVSENQLQGLRTLQEDTNKYLHQLTKLISDSDSTISPITGVPKPAPFSGHADEDFSLWLDYFKAIASLHHWLPDACAKLLHVFLTGPALCYFQGLDVEVRDNFDAATSALKERFDDATIRNSLHLQLHNLKQGPTDSVTDFCFALERTFIRLNITAELYKLLVSVDGVLPHLRFEIHKCAPQTYAETKTMALNLEIALRARSHHSVSTVGQSSFAESQSLEHKINNLQHEINSLKQSIKKKQRISRVLEISVNLALAVIPSKYINDPPPETLCVITVIKRTTSPENVVQRSQISALTILYHVPLKILILCPT